MFPFVDNATGYGCQMLKTATIAITYYFLAVVVGLDGRRRGYAVIRTIRRLAKGQT
jgi:hypothetical protein